MRKSALNSTASSLLEIRILATAAIAALLEKAKLKVGEKVVVIVSGANISLNTLRTVLSKHNKPQVFR